jgi:hypothetical protein
VLTWITRINPISATSFASRGKTVRIDGDQGAKIALKADRKISTEDLAAAVNIIPPSLTPEKIEYYRTRLQ